jgi:hypothetical protein
VKYDQMIAMFGMGVLLSEIIQDPPLFTISGYDLYTFHRWFGEMIRYNQWRATWDLTEEMDYVKGYSE